MYRAAALLFLDAAFISKSMYSLLGILFVPLKIVLSGSLTHCIHMWILVPSLPVVALLQP